MVKNNHIEPKNNNGAMMKHTARLFALSIALVAHGAHADDDKIRARLAEFGVTGISISDAPIAGLRQVMSDQGAFYASADGDYFLQGSLVRMTDEGPVDLTYQPYLDRINAHSADMIVYKAKEEKHVVNVFFDITCHYCKVMYQNNQGYNDLGITVRYLAFPRNGLASKTAQQMETIWQSADRHAALAEAEKGKAPSTETRVDIVKKQYELGLMLGIQGTPAILSDKGQFISGYLPPQELLARLQE